MTDTLINDAFKVDDIVYAGRPPHFNFPKDKKQNRGKILQVLPAARRVPLRYLVLFDLPHPITKETESVVVPHKRRDRQLVIPADDTPTTTDTALELGTAETVPLIPKTLSLTPTPTPTTTTETILDPDSTYTVPLIPEALILAPTPTPMTTTDTPPESKKRRLHTCSLCGQIRRGHVCPKKALPSCILDRGVTNTPVFGICIKQVLCNKINRLGAAYNRKLVLTAKIIQLVTGVGTKLSVRKISGVWQWSRGFLQDMEVWMVSATLSIQFSHLANDFGWGVDSASFWCRPIFFKKSLGTDGKQWVRQILKVFPVRTERLNWARQYHLRTRTLKGGPKHNGSKLCYKRTPCHRCGEKTKCFHVLSYKFECKSCVNQCKQRNCLITQNQVMQTFKHVTRISLRQVSCIRIQSAELWKPSRYYLQSSVQKLARRVQKGNFVDDIY